MRRIFREGLEIIREFGWRSFGALLVVLGGGAAAGGILLNDVWMGVLAAWVTVVLTALGLIGAVIMFTGNVDRADVARAWQKAGKDLIEAQDQDRQKRP